MFESNLTLHANLVPDATDSPRLCIHGTAVINQDDEHIEVQRAHEPIGNPNILRLILTGRRTDGAPNKGTMQPFTYTESGRHVSDYRQITVRYGKRIVCFQYSHNSSRQLSEV